MSIKQKVGEKKRRKKLMYDTMFGCLMVLLMFYGLHFALTATENKFFILILGVAIQFSGFFAILRGSTKIGLTLAMLGTDIEGTFIVLIAGGYITLW